MLTFPYDAHTGDWGDAVAHDFDFDKEFEVVVKVFQPHRNRHGDIVERQTDKYEREDKNKKLLADAEDAESTLRKRHWDNMVVGETRQLSSRATIKRIR